MFAIPGFAQHTKKDLIGKWQGTDPEGTKELISFVDTTRVLTTINGEVMPQGNYIVDFSKKTATLDIKLTRPDGSIATLPGFVVFLDDDTIKWQIFLNGDRPAIMTKILRMDR